MSDHGLDLLRSLGLQPAVELGYYQTVLGTI